eukprot:CAMPEP_0206409054 /NCGR_PEP_ID=MMETSP0294-20121207/31591_1 /ASSEMBLY_ACC=CAM_ASM_000327 /TAXON_ID=39354 /ORGANISM="Heterosigma akashiwo, Strain CCMP2393" /LENGTH=37 /DNA_ID= /DNA_START= /DNA_END= /DNA_ORIENTATION=
MPVPPMPPPAPMGCCWPPIIPLPIPLPMPMPMPMPMP